MTSRAAFLAALALLFVASPLVAQEKEPLPLALPTGVKARLSTTAVPGLVHGIIVRSDDESVTFLLERGSEQRVPIEQLNRLEISVSQKRQTLKGAIIGTVIGVGFGFLMPVDSYNCGSYSENFCSRGEAVGGGMLAGALTGTLVGALVHTDRWTPVNLQGFESRGPSTARSARLTPALGITFRF